MIRVPGKVFLCGEYAVLDGAPAVVAAVGVYGRAQLSGSPAPGSPFVEEAVRRTLAWASGRGLSLSRGSPIVDTTAFRAPGGNKLGLGSSAVTTVGVIAALLDSAGLALQEPQVRQDLSQLALDAHRAAQRGEGSGGDVAACVHGGFIKYARGAPKRSPEAPTIERLRPPPGLSLALAWSGTSASTPDLVARVRQVASGFEALSELAGEFAERFAAGDVAEIIRVARLYGQAMRALGERTGADIVIPALATYMAIAERHGGSAKPSGAGGGDLGVAFLPSAEAAAAVQREAALAGLVPCELGWDSDGVRRERV